MSYDIYLLQRLPGQSWEEALEALEEAQEAQEAREALEGEAELSDEMAAAWERIVPRARELLGEIGLFGSASQVELDHRPTGIQLSIFGSEVAISVPYRTRGDDADEVLSKIYQLAAIAAQETGLEAYDPQLGEGIADLLGAQPRVAVAIFDQVADRFGRA